MASQIIGLQLPMPTGPDVDVRDWPLTVDFLDVTDDGVNFTLYYYQRDQAEPLTKSRRLELHPPVAVLNDDGRNFIGILSNGFTVWENTENAIPDQLIRNP